MPPALGRCQCNPPIAPARDIFRKDAGGLIATDQLWATYESELRVTASCNPFENRQVHLSGCVETQSG
jgi:hypothetical protein